MLDHAQLPELLHRAVFELQPMFRGVPIMFDPPYRRTVQPRFAVDDATGDSETDFLEVAWLRDRPPGETADFWRVSPHGFATIVRDYAEDASAGNAQLGLQPGTWFSPNVLAQQIAELACHARGWPGVSPACGVHTSAANGGDWRGASCSIRKPPGRIVAPRVTTTALRPARLRPRGWRSHGPKSSRS
jgi:hypothetical protein